MNSETSTDATALRRDDSLQAWQLFVLAALACATAATFMARGRGLVPIVLLSALMGSAVLVGLAALRALRPLVTADVDESVLVGRRSRSLLEREKALALRSIKELEFDRAMGKVSDADWAEMSGRLRARAARLIRQLDAGGGYREEIELALAERLRQGGIYGSVAVPSVRPAPQAPASAPPTSRACDACTTANDPDARFCKQCGQAL